MTSTAAVPRYIHGVLVFIVLSGCRSAVEPGSVKAIDLMRDFNRAEKRPAVTFETEDLYPTLDTRTTERRCSERRRR